MISAMHRFWAFRAMGMVLALLGAIGPAARADKPITDKDREHWAFRPVQKPALPPVKNQGWIANPIDA